MGKKTREERRSRWQVLILTMMFLGYAAMMMCKVAFTALSPAMKRDPSLGLTTAKYGRIVSWNSLGAVAGKAVTGLGADKMGGRKMLIAAMVFLAITTAAFGVSHLYVFALLNFSTMFFKAGGWPAMTKIIGAWYPRSKHGRVWSIVSMSSRVGTVVGGVLISWLLLSASWRTVFLAAAAPAMLVAVLVWFVLKERPEDVGLSLVQPGDDESCSRGGVANSSGDDSASDTQQEVVHPLDGTTLGQACLVFVRSPRVVLMALSMMLLNILMDFINFLPIYLSESLSFSDSKAALIGSTVFPAGMFAALALCSVGYDWVSKKQLVRIIGALLAVACLCITILWKLPTFDLDSGEAAVVSMTTIFVLGFAVSPAYYLPMSVFSVSFGGKHSGFLVSFLDIFGYMGSFFFAFFGGAIAEDHGWHVFLFLLLVVASLSFLVMTAFLKLDYVAENRSSRRSS